MPDPVIELSDLRFAWPGHATPVVEIDALSVDRGERVFLQGPSGSGKTTLLNLLGGLAVPQAGRVAVAGTDIARLGRAARDRFRADHVGFIFQLFNLVPYLGLVDNVALPCRFSRARRARAAARSGSVGAEAARLLSRMGLASLDRPVAELSVGQQQRVAAARALIGGPEVVIADEPTSALDADAGKAFLDLLFEEVDQAGATLVLVSHDDRLAPMFGRTVELGAINRAGRT